MSDIKFTVIGNAHSGKTAFVKRFLTTDEFISEYHPSDEINISTAPLVGMGNSLLQVWDTNGNLSKSSSLLFPLYEKANAIVLCVDLSTRDSLKSIKDWAKEARDYGNHNIPIMLVGTKADITTREISNLDLQTAAKKFGLLFNETTNITSARNDENIFECFVKILKVAKKNFTHPKTFWERHQSTIETIIMVGFFVSLIGAFCAALLTPMLAPFVLPILGLSATLDFAPAAIIMTTLGLIVTPAITAVIAALITGIFKCFTKCKEHRQLDNNSIELEPLSSYTKINTDLPPKTEKDKDIELDVPNTVQPEITPLATEKLDPDFDEEFDSSEDVQPVSRRRCTIL